MDGLSTLIKKSLSDEIDAWVASGGEIKIIGSGKTTKVESGFNNKNKKKTDTMNKIIENSIEEHRSSKTPASIARTYAKTHGLKHYRGAECKKCGANLRFTISSSCVYCNRVESRERFRNKRKSEVLS